MIGNGDSTAEAVQPCKNARKSFAAVGDRDNAARTTGDFSAVGHA
jgi:hypothetical protein